jgi:hypothetical protein
MESFIINEIKNTFSGLNNELNEIIKILTQSPETFSSTLWDTINAIYILFLPIGYSLITLFFIIEFLQKSVMFEYMRWENVIKSLIKLVIAKLIMENCFKFLNLMFDLSATLIEEVGNVKWMASPSGGTAGYSANLSTIISNIQDMNFVEQLSYYSSISPWIVVMKGIKIIILLIVYGRMIELLILTAISPIPTSTLACESTHGIAKRYFLNFFAVCFQGLIIYIGTIIYSGFLVQTFQTTNTSKILLSMILSSLILLIILIKSGTWSKQIFNA